MTIRTSAFLNRKKKESIVELRKTRGLYLLLSHSDGTKDVVDIPC